MSRKTFMMLFAIAVVFGISKPSYAIMCLDHIKHMLAGSHDGHGQASATDSSQAVSEGKAINVGNKICPVSGERINESARATYEYEGKVYNFCCPMCIADFKKDPQKYIQKVDEELKADTKQEAAGAAEADAQSQASEEAAPSHHH